MTPPALLRSIVWAAIAFFTLPMILVIMLSFQSVHNDGGQLVASNGYALLTSTPNITGSILFDVNQFAILLEGVLYAGATTLVCLIMGLPLAYFIFLQPQHKRIYYVIVVSIPFWIGVLVRTTGLAALFSEHSLVYLFLPYSISIETQSKLVLVIGLVSSYLPLMILAIVAGFWRVSADLLEVAYDLYATRFVVLFRVVMPVAASGIGAGCALVFLPAAASIIEPMLLLPGEANTLGTVLIGYLVNEQSWPVASALVSIVLGVVIMMSILRRTPQAQ